MGDGGPRQAVVRRALLAQLGGCNSTRHGSCQVTQNTTGAGNGLLGVSATLCPHALVPNTFFSLNGTGTPFQAQTPCALVPIQMPRAKDTGLQGSCQGCVHIFRIAGGCSLRVRLHAPVARLGKSYGWWSAVTAALLATAIGCEASALLRAYHCLCNQ